MKKQVVLDIETDRSWKTIWMVGLYFPATDECLTCTTVDELYTALSGVDELIGHNIYGFDLPVMREVWGFEWNRRVSDTLCWGRLLDPSCEGGHSLRAWAERSGGATKEDFDPADFDLGLTQRMIDYCHADLRATWSVYEHMETRIEEGGFSWASVRLEEEVRRITTQQERNGFAFNFPMACELHENHKERMDEIEKELQETFPPIVEERWSDKTGKRLKDKVTVFNPGSRQQVAERLEAKGAVWKARTETGKPKVDETTLADNKHIPGAALVLEFLTLSKRLGMLRSWLDAVQEDGRIHGRVNTCGAVTGRMTHSSPNMAQIPSESLYRSCFTVSEGNKLVGIDASGLELRMLAHYMNDPEYTDLILHGDIHTHNQQAFGCDTRSQAKTLIYAVLYGAGNAKLGSVLGKGERAGAKARANFERAVPAYARLTEKVKAMANKRGSLPGLDGRRVHVRSEHAALNTLLQSAGAIVMKKALVIAVQKLANYGYPYKLVAQVHDEYQVEVPEEYAERVGVIFRNAIREAGRVLDLRCPLDGEYQIGDTWADTH